MIRRAPLATSVVLYGSGVVQALSTLGVRMRKRTASVQACLHPNVWGGSVTRLTGRTARQHYGRWSAGAGLAGLVLVGGPALQAHTLADDDAHQWRARAKASLIALQSPRDAAPAREAAARVRAVADARHSAYAVHNAAAQAPFQRVTPAVFNDAARRQSEHHCLSRAIYYEARAESGVGQYAVAEVVMNRVRHHTYPNTVCGVVYEGSHRATGCQFTFTCDGSERRAPRGRAWDRAQRIAALTLMDLAEPVTGDATHYHADYVHPYWAPSLVRTEVIGAHIFYRMPGRG